MFCSWWFYQLLIFNSLNLHHRGGWTSVCLPTWETRLYLACCATLPWAIPGPSSQATRFQAKAALDCACLRTQQSHFDRINLIFAKSSVLLNLLAIQLNCWTWVSCRCSLRIKYEMETCWDLNRKWKVSYWMKIHWHGNVQSSWDEMWDVYKSKIIPVVLFSFAIVFFLPGGVIFLRLKTGKATPSYFCFMGF